MKGKFKLIGGFVLLSLLAGCSKNTGNTVKTTPQNDSSKKSTIISKIDQTKWKYQKEDNVYWQVGISYCSNPADTQYETLGIYVPGAYMNAKENGDGTYTCTINQKEKVGNYTADTAPVVIPVDTPGYSAMAAPTDYNSKVSAYTNEGFVYVNPGCRGRDAGAPAGVTDLKAAVRYIRYRKSEIPGSMDHIFTFGMSGGGAQSALMGATGDSELYTPYLNEIGAVSNTSDAVAGSMCWCPITNLDYADEAYEWNMGVTRTGLDGETQKLSDEMAKSFANYINKIGLKDENGNVLTLTKSKEGIYQSGSYYEYLKDVVENSLNHFLEDTTFPYSAQTTGKGGMRGADNGERPDRGNLRDGEKPDKGQLPDGQLPDKKDGNDADIPIEERDGVNRKEISGGVALAGSYETIQDYIDALNTDTTWVTYNKKTKKATITSMADFVTACKNAFKNVGAFDDLDKNQPENELFGYGNGTSAHFDPVMADLLKNNEKYGQTYQEDLKKKDALGNTVDYRANMYNPMYYLCNYYKGYQTSTVAKYWRIRTGINQGDTALSTEVNLALALNNYKNTEVDFETVWGQAHVEAERTGDSSSNFIAWVNDCVK